MTTTRKVWAVRVRRASKGDGREVSRMWAALHEVRRRPAILRFKADQLCVVAEAEGKVVGYCRAIFYRYGPVAIGHVEELYVKPAFRKRGAGASLVGRVVDAAKQRGIEALFASAMPGDRRARTFYQELGWWRMRGPTFVLPTGPRPGGTRTH